MRVTGSTSTPSGLVIWLRPVPNVDETRFVWPRTFEAGPPGDGRHAGEGTAPTTTPTSSATTTKSACTTTCLFVQFTNREREREREREGNALRKGANQRPVAFSFLFVVGGGGGVVVSWRGSSSSLLLAVKKKTKNESHQQKRKLSWPTNRVASVVGLFFQNTKPQTKQTQAVRNVWSF